MSGVGFLLNFFEKLKEGNQEKRGREQEMHGTGAVRCKVR